MPNAKRQTRNAKIDIDKVAKLANLKLTAKERKTFQKQLEEVLVYVSSLGEVDTKKVEPIGNITGLQNISREDEPSPSLPQEDSLKNAKKTYNGFFEVDAIFAEEGPES